MLPPFDMAELLARLKAAAPRSQAMAALVFRSPLSVDFGNRRVLLDTEIHLAHEYSLLRYLVKCGEGGPHQQLLREVWGLAHLEDVQYWRADAPAQAKLN